jgi:hypothetical protein
MTKYAMALIVLISTILLGDVVTGPVGAPGAAAKPVVPSGASPPPTSTPKSVIMPAATQRIQVDVRNPPAQRDPVKDYGPVFVAVVSLFLAYLYNRKILHSNNVNEERKDIHTRLNEFYGPLRQLLGVSRDLYGRFRYSKPDNFRTLIVLLEGHIFEGNDKALLEQILKVTRAIDQLILKKSGLVDNLELHALLSKASTHFRLMRLAYEGQLSGDIERFQDHIFPLELAERIDAQIEGLQSRLNDLNRM